MGFGAAGERYRGSEKPVSWSECTSFDVEAPKQQGWGGHAPEQLYSATRRDLQKIDHLYAKRRPNQTRYRSARSAGPRSSKTSFLNNNSSPARCVRVATANAAPQAGQISGGDLGTSGLLTVYRRRRGAMVFKPLSDRWRSNQVLVPSWGSAGTITVM